MESIKNIYLVSKFLFFSTGSVIFLLAFFLRNGFFTHYSKFGILILDVPFLFFGLVYLLSNIKKEEEEYNSVMEGFISFFGILIFALIVFFHFAFPDLI